MYSSIAGPSTLPPPSPMTPGSARPLGLPPHRRAGSFVADQRPSPSSSTRERAMTPDPFASPVSNPRRADTFSGSVSGSRPSSPFVSTQKSPLTRVPANGSGLGGDVEARPLKARPRAQVSSPLVSRAEGSSSSSSSSSHSPYRSVPNVTSIANMRQREKMDGEARTRSRSEPQTGTPSGMVGQGYDRSPSLAKSSPPMPSDSETDADADVSANVSADSSIERSEINPFAFLRAVVVSPELADFFVRHLLTAPSSPSKPDSRHESPGHSRSPSLTSSIPAAADGETSATGLAGNRALPHFLFLLSLLALLRSTGEVGRNARRQREKMANLVQGLGLGLEDEVERIAGNGEKEREEAEKEREEDAWDAWGPFIVEAYLYPLPDVRLTAASPVPLSPTSLRRSNSNPTLSSPSASPRQQIRTLDDFLTGSCISLPDSSPLSPSSEERTLRCDWLSPLRIAPDLLHDRIGRGLACTLDRVEIDLAPSDLRYASGQRTHAEALAREACLSAISWFAIGQGQDRLMEFADTVSQTDEDVMQLLSRGDSVKAPTSASETLADLLSQQRLPAADVDLALLQTIAQTLQDRRAIYLDRLDKWISLGDLPPAARAPHRWQDFERPYPSDGCTHTFRWILASLLETFLGSEYQQRYDQRGNAIYASTPALHQAIDGFFDIDPSSDDDEWDDEVELEMSNEEAVRAANRSIQKRDEKLRWIFGPGDHGPSSTERPDSRPRSTALRGHKSSKSEPGYTGLYDGQLSSLRRGSEQTIGSSETGSAATRQSGSTIIFRNRASIVSGTSLPRSASETSTIDVGIPLHRNESISSMARLLDLASTLPEATAEEEITDADESDPMRVRFSRRPYSVCVPGSDNIISPSVSFDRPEFTSQFTTSHKMSSRSRIEAQFERIISPLPPTSNELSSEERRHMVRKSRKLQAMLGATLDEIQVEQSLFAGKPTTGHSSSFDRQDLRLELGDAPLMSRQSSGRHFRTPSDPARPVSLTQDIEDSNPTLLRRHSSFPPTSTSLSSNYERRESYLWSDAPSRADSVLRSDDELASPTSLSRSSSVAGSVTDMTSPETAFSPDTPASYAAFSPRGFGGASGARDDRRKKLDKIHRFLGERVPLAMVETPNGPAMVVDTSALQHPEPPTRKNSNTRTMLGKFSKFRMGVGNRRQQSASSDSISSMASQPQPKHRPAASLSLGGEHNVASIRRARKLEKMFGELPPTSLYGNTVSARSSLSPDANQLSRSHAFRSSIASLAYIAENDPHSLDHLARVYQGTDSSEFEEMDDALSAAADSAEKSGSAEHRAASIESAIPALTDEGSSTYSRATSRSSDRMSSSDTHATHVKRAKKLASFFGTTRGEVFNRVLDDIQAAVEDEDLLPEERNSLLLQVNRLRNSPGNL